MFVASAVCSLLLLVLLPSASECRFDVEVLEEPLGAELGKRVVMAVQADVDVVEDCRWVSPDGVRYRAGDDDDDSDDDRRRSDYRVELDDNECSLTIRRMKEEDEGPWECHLEDEDEEEEMRLVVKLFCQISF